MTKRVLNSLTIGKIAAVDFPCQEHAQAAIMKRRVEVTDEVWKGKYTAEQRREMAGKEAMADGSYPIKDEDDLERAIHAVGRGKNNSHASIRAHIKSRAKALGLSDKIPEDWKGSEVAKALSDIFSKAGLAAPAEAETFAEQFEDQLLLQGLWDNYWKAQTALQDSITSIIKDDSVTDKASMIKQSLDEFCAYIADLVPADITKSLTAGLAATIAGGAGPTLKGDTMSEAMKKALGLPATATEAEVTKALADLTKRATDAEALAKVNELLAKMSDKHKAFMDGGKMPKGGKDAYMAMSADERDKHIADCDGDNDVAKMLKSGDAFEAISGAVITKKAAGVMFDVLKANDTELRKAREDIAKAKDKEEAAEFAKRAVDHGQPEAFGATMRKAFGKDGDAAAQAEVWKTIKGLGAQVAEGSLFDTFGKKNPKEGSAESEFVAKVAELKKAKPELSEQQAYSRVYKARENADLVKRMTAEQARSAN